MTEIATEVETAQKTGIDGFETALAELNQIVERMEQGKLSLEDSLKSFERGVSLVKHCQQTLKNAEQKVQILTEKEGQTVLENYQVETEA
jgi:exodeoxyribonuclease VII small subunit